MLYMIEDSMRKREEDVSRKTNEDLMQNRDNLKYEQLIKDIRTLYPIKMKGSNKRY